MEWKKECSIRLEIAVKDLHSGTRLHEWNPGATMAVGPISEKSEYMIAIETIPGAEKRRNVCVLELTEDTWQSIVASIPDKSKEVFEYVG